MTEKLSGEVSTGNDEDISQVIVILKAILDECMTRAGMEKYADDQIDYLKEGRNLKSMLDKLRIDEFQKNSAEFNLLQKNYEVLVLNEKERLQRLKNLVDTLTTLVDFATILDDAAKIAAGLSKSA